jgi:HAD superfamily hydrolase (TIGR01509 family)
MIRALIFDLCDTVVRTAGLPGLVHLPGVAGHHDEKSLERWLLDSNEFYAFERGEIGADEFFAAFRTGLKLHATNNELGRAFEELILHEIEGVGLLLRKLAADYPLYALSNNNVVLWQGVQRVCNSLDVFEEIFLSQEIGLLKPEPAAFHYTLQQIGCQPQEAVLIDDNPRCIAAAAQLNMATVLFRDAAKTEHELAEIIKNKKLA